MKERAGLETKRVVVALVDIGAGKIGRQEIGSKLQALKITFNAIGQGFYSPGFGQSGSPFNQQVAIGQQGNQETFDQNFLADNLSFHTFFGLLKSFPGLVADRSDILSWVCRFHKEFFSIFSVSGVRLR